MKLKYFLLFSIVCVNVFVLRVHAEEVVWDVNLNLSKQHQSFESSSADLTTLSLDPSLQYGNWDFSLSVPWYRSEGEYYLNGVRPLLVARCTKLQGLTATQIQKLINRGILTEKQVARCENFMNKLDELNEPHSGIGDVTAFIHYSFAVDNDEIWKASAGLGYKSDSGDASTGLGSGTKDVMFELGISAATERNLFNLVIGYDSIIDSNDFKGVYEPENYAYASAELSRLINDWLTLGATLNIQQSNIAEGDDTKSVTGYVDFIFSPQWNLHCYMSRYANTQFSPDSEFGVNIRYTF